MLGRFLLLFGFVCQAFVSVPAQAGEGSANPLSENLRWAVDLSTRTTYDTGLNRFFFTQFAGIDVHKVFTYNNRDVGTAVVQFYLTRIDWPSPMKPHFFDSSNDTRIIPRIVTFNFTGLPRVGQRLNIKVGHFELPFGHEHIVDTNGTVHDFMHGRNLGLKTDYGFTLNGVVDGVVYEVGLSRGSGVDYRDRGSPWATMGRVGGDVTDSVTLGGSYFVGEVLDPPGVMRFKTGLPSAIAMTDTRGADGNIRRYRVAADVKWVHYAWTLLGEFSYGRDFDQDVSNNYVELDWSNSSEQVILYGQLFNFNQKYAVGWQDAWESKLGVQWLPDNHWDLSAEYAQQIANFLNTPTKARLTGQVRVRF